MKLDKTGLLLVGAAALVLLTVVKKTTPAGAPNATKGQSAIGANAASFWSNVINNVGGNPTMATTGAWNPQSLPGGVTLFGNGTFDAGGIYVDPGQLTYDTSTGRVQETPLSGMYNLLSPATYGQ